MYFICIILLCIVLNSNPVSLIMKLLNSHKTKDNEYIFKAADNKCKNNKTFENFVGSDVKEHLTVNGQRCRITKNKELKCDCKKPCQNTVNGCCKNSSVPKIDKAGTNCKDVKGYPGFIVLSAIITIIFSISFFILNITNRKLLSVICFIICTILIFLVLFISFNYIDVIQNGIDIVKSYNTCLHVIRYYATQIGTSYWLSWSIYGGMALCLIVFGSFYLLCKKWIFESDYEQPFSSFFYILLSLGIFILVIGLIFFNFVIGLSYPGIYLLIMVCIRYFWIFVSKCMMMSISDTKGSLDTRFQNKRHSNHIYLRLTCLSSLYSIPIEYMYQMIKDTFSDNKLTNQIKVYNILKSNIDIDVVRGLIYRLKPIDIDLNQVGIQKNMLENLELPTGMPWDSPGVKLFKLITISIYNLLNKPRTAENEFNRLKPIMRRLIKDLEKTSGNKKTIIEKVHKFIMNNELNKNFLKFLRFGMNYIPDLTKNTDNTYDYFASNSQLFTSPFNIFLYIMNIFDKF